MATRLRYIAALACVPFTLSMGVANASNFSSVCATPYFDNVEIAINRGEFLTVNAETNRTNLLAKLAGADAKMLQKKPSDAIDLLQAIPDKATEWANFTPKPKLTDATEITQRVDDAMPCLK